jgi:two-component system response regulator
MTAEDRLLLVESDAEDELLIVDALRAIGFHHAIDIARDGAEALEYLFASEVQTGREDGSNPQLVLLNWNVPGISAPEVLERVREHRRTRLIPVVVLGSSSDEVEISKSYRYGANSYVTKPSDFTQFVNAVQKIGAYWLNVNQTPGEPGLPAPYSKSDPGSSAGPTTPPG